MTSVPGGSERRRHHALREVLDELLEHVRDLTNRAQDMPAADLEYAQQRLEWLADEVWRNVSQIGDLD